VLGDVGQPHLVHLLGTEAVLSDDALINDSEQIVVHGRAGLLAVLGAFLAETRPPGVD
jgi:hypothetical protein